MHTIAPPLNSNSLSRETAVGLALGLLVLVILVIPVMIAVVALVYRARRRDERREQVERNSLRQTCDRNGKPMFCTALNYRC